MATGELRSSSASRCIGDFDPANYTSEFIWVTARDGEHVPVSIVRASVTPLDGRAPLFLYGYGAYGVCIEPSFSSARLSLLDRGLVYAIAHIRGGQEVGRRWYDSGRLLAKWNTFHDFIDVTDHLVAQGYGAPDRVVAAGGSAGGLLVGVVMNTAPEKYAGIVANVPFVDIVTTMLDESIPLTTLEYEEWGDPKDARLLRVHAFLFALRQRLPARLSCHCLSRPACGTARCSISNPPSGWRSCARHDRQRTAAAARQPRAGHGGKSGRYEQLLRSSARICIRDWIDA